MDKYLSKYHIWYDHKGYPCITVAGKEIKLHVFIWEQAHGEKPDGYEVHHKDRNKGNYDLSNLELLTNSDHGRVHAGWVRENGVFVAKPCNRCGQILPLDQFYFVKTRNIQTALCKKCHNEVVAERNKRPENVEKLREYKRDYARAHYVKTGGKPGPKPKK
jgi:hypothetical protein